MTIESDATVDGVLGAYRRGVAAIESIDVKALTDEELAAWVITVSNLLSESDRLIARLSAAMKDRHTPQAGWRL